MEVHDMNKKFFTCLEKQITMFTFASFFSMNRILMPFKYTFVIGPKITLITPKLLDMNLHMTVQVPFILEHFRTKLALDFLDICVNILYV